MHDTEDRDRRGETTKLLLTTAEACQALSISPWYLGLHVRRGTIKSIKLGRRRLYSLHALQEFIAGLEERPPA